MPEGTVVTGSAGKGGPTTPIVDCTISEDNGWSAEGTFIDTTFILPEPTSMSGLQIAEMSYSSGSVNIRAYLDDAPKAVANYGFTFKGTGKMTILAPIMFPTAKASKIRIRIEYFCCPLLIGEVTYLP